MNSMSAQPNFAITHRQILSVRVLGAEVTSTTVGPLIGSLFRRGLGADLEH